MDPNDLFLTMRAWGRDQRRGQSSFQGFQGYAKEVSIDLWYRDIGVGSRRRSGGRARRGGPGPIWVPVLPSILLPDCTLRGRIFNHSVSYHPLNTVHPASTTSIFVCHCQTSNLDPNEQNAVIMHHGHGGRDDLFL